MTIHKPKIHQRERLDQLKDYVTQYQKLVKESQDPPGGLAWWLRNTKRSITESEIGYCKAEYVIREAAKRKESTL